MCFSCSICAKEGYDGSIKTIPSLVASAGHCIHFGRTGLWRLISYPYMLSLYRGQQYINPRVSIKPNEAYELELWIKWPTLADTSPLQNALDDYLQAFQAKNPNVKVNITYLSDTKAMQKLGAAIAAGKPPDLFFHADSSQSYFGELQVPLSLYLTPTEKAAWPTAVWQQASIKKEVYGLPVALYPRVLMMNTALWQPSNITREEVLQAGWNWEQFIAAIELATQARVHGFVPASVGRSFAEALAASQGQPIGLHQDGTLLWSTELLHTLAQLWEKISTCKGIAKPSSEMDSNCLNLFLEGKAACIGPLNHYLASWLWDAALQQGIQPALWPRRVKLNRLPATREVSTSVFLGKLNIKGTAIPKLALS